MKIDNNNDGITFQNIQIDLQKKVYLSKHLLEKAKNIGKEPTKTAVIYNDKVIGIDNTILNSLKDSYKGDFQQYEGILISNGKAKNYLEKISEYVLNDLNVKNADKNKDGMISMAESLDTKNIIDEKTNSILKPRDVLAPDLIAKIEKDNSNFMSVEDIINLHILLDKNKDGKVSIKEAKKDVQKTDYQIVPAYDALNKLYKRLEKIQKEIATITSKMAHADKDHTKVLQEKLAVKNTELVALLDQIKKKLGIIFA